MRLAGDSSFGDEGVSALSSGLIGSRSLQALDLENKVDVWGPAGPWRQMEYRYMTKGVCVCTVSVYLRGPMGEDIQSLRIMPSPLILESRLPFPIRTPGGAGGLEGHWLTRLSFPDLQAIGAPGAQTLSTVLAQSLALKRLNLSRNPLGDDGECARVGGDREGPTGGGTAAAGYA